MSVLTTTCPVVEGGVRLDVFVTGTGLGISRAAAQRLIGDGHILVDDLPRKPSYRLRSGETVSIAVPPLEPATAQAESIPLDIVYEDDDMVVVNKPAGMVVHPAAGHSGGTLVNALLAHVSSLSVGGVERPGIVHRLDKDTSGLIVVAKNDATLHALQAQWKSRQVHKVYLALVEGTILPPQGKIEAPIGRDPKHRQRMAVLTQGKTRQAVTVYHTIANLKEHTLVRAEPETGRTHQIRVHFAFMGFPVVGDAIYGKSKNALGLGRQFLHAWQITFDRPGRGAITLRAGLPADLRATLQILEYDGSEF